jgi:sensor c-di-GMP phosphodiesterase-like protein
VAVNVSGQQILDEGFVPAVREALDASGLWRDLSWRSPSPRSSTPGGHRPPPERDQGAGARVSVDDFGTGFSALPTSSTCPSTALQIDRLVRERAPDDRSDVAITRTILALAANLGLGTVAEGSRSFPRPASSRSTAAVSCRGTSTAAQVPADQFPDLAVR